jgi:hypothetical protein
MKLKMKLEQIINNRQEKTESWTFIFKPTLDEYQKRVVFKVSTGDPMETMGNLGLPQSINDTIILEMIRKEEQKKIGEK